MLIKPPISPKKIDIAPLKFCAHVYIFDHFHFSLWCQQLKWCLPSNTLNWSKRERSSLQCPARMDIGISRSEKWNENLLHSFREVKSEMKIWFTHFENEKWNEKALRSRSRMKSEMKMAQDRDREWKVKWKCFEIEIEKWNFSRILEKFSRIKKCFRFRSKFFSSCKFFLFLCICKKICKQILQRTSLYFTYMHIFTYIWNIFSLSGKPV